MLWTCVWSLVNIGFRLLVYILSIVFIIERIQMEKQKTKDAYRDAEELKLKEVRNKMRDQ